MASRTQLHHRKINLLALHSITSYKLWSQGLNFIHTSIQNFNSSQPYWIELEHRIQFTLLRDCILKLKDLLVISPVIKMEAIMRVASKKGVVIFSKSSCCMCYTVKILFHELGVNPLIHELDHDPEGKDMEKALTRMGCNTAVPAVYINGQFIGSTNEIMSLHLSGSLLPLVRPYQDMFP